MADDTEIASLRREMGARLDAVEHWLERVTTAIERMAANGERLARLEVRVEGMDTTVLDLKKTVGAVSRTSRHQEVQIARLDMVKVAALFVAATVASVAIKKLGLF